MTKLSAPDLQTLSRQLHAMKEIAQSEIRLANDDLKQDREAGASEVHSFSDDAETLQADNVRLAEIDIDKTRLAEIEFAERLIAEGLYGKCIECGCNIARARLMA
ncbi:hypothetical protein BH11PSE13_BH11PSE13_44990 [soil metagenome]